jgi:hypothetical protein
MDGWMDGWFEKEVKEENLRSEERGTNWDEKNVTK